MIDVLHLLTEEAPPADGLRRIREAMEISRVTLARALRFKEPEKTGERVVRRWEQDPDFRPTPTAWQAFRSLALLVHVYDKLPDGMLRHDVAAFLPESIR